MNSSNNTLIVKLLPTSNAKLTTKNLDLTTPDNPYPYPSTAKKFPDKPEINISNNFTENKTSYNNEEKLNKFNIQPYFAQQAAYQLSLQDIKPLIVLFANPNHAGGYGETAKAQEENILKDSNAPYATPKQYENGLILTYGGLYAITNANLSANNQIIPVDFVFVPMPDLSQPTSHEYSYTKDRESYLRHVTSLMILQFHAAKNCGNVMITGRQGCGVFANKDEDIAAIIHTVASLTEFKDVKVVYALGSSRQLDNTYLNPPQNIIHEVENTIQTIQNDIDDLSNITALSNDMRIKYAEKIAPEHALKIKIDTIQKKLNAYNVKIIPYAADSKNLPRYQLIFASKKEAQDFSEHIFNTLGIASTNKQQPKAVREKNDLIFTSGQFEMLHYLDTKNIKNQPQEKLSENEKYLIEKYLIKFDNKLFTNDSDKEKINAFKTMLAMNEKGYTKKYALLYIKEVYPDLFKIVFSNKSDAEELFNALKNNQIPADNKNPNIIALKKLEDQFMLITFKEDKQTVKKLQNDFMHDLQIVLDGGVNSYELNIIKQLADEGQLMKQNLGFFETNPVKKMLHEYENNKKATLSKST